jgi:cytochrome c
MFKPYILIFTIILFTLFSCGNTKEEKKDSFSYENITSTTKNPTVETKIPASKKVDLVSKGIGPISKVELSGQIDYTLAKKGESIFKKMCTACHRPDKKFIGPEAKGLINIRTPEWIMNMILNPDEMIRKDPLAKELLIEFNYAPMIKQNLTQDEARAILEYYRTLK